VGQTDWVPFSIALIFIQFQPAEKSYLASMIWLLKEAQGKATIVLSIETFKMPKKSLLNGTLV
jgi:hypothetical protein